MVSGTRKGATPSPLNERVWVSDYFAETQPKMDSLIKSRLRRNLYSIFGEDVLQEACCRLMVIFRRPRYAGIDATNWREPDPRAILDRCAFTTLNLTLLEMIRGSKKFDHGAEKMDQCSANPSAPVDDLAESRNKVAAALQELPERYRDFWQLAGIEGRSYKEIAEQWGVSEGLVRLIRFRLVAALRSRLRQGRELL